MGRREEGMPRFVGAALGSVREGSRRSWVEVRSVLWLWFWWWWWWWWFVVFCSSGGRFRVGGLLVELSGVKAGMLPASGREKSQSTGDCSQGCRLLPKAVSKASMSRPWPPLASCQTCCCIELPLPLEFECTFPLPSSLLCLFFGRPICFWGE